MTLRSKTLIAIGGAVLCSLLIVYVISATVLVRPFLQIDSDAARRDAERARDAISEDIRVLDTVAGDYATWDETCTFVETRNASYITRNLADGALMNLGVETIAVTDASHRVVFSKSMDLERGVARSTSKEFLDQLRPGSPLVDRLQSRGRAKGVLLLRAGPMLVASRPILTSNGQGPVRGAVIMARPLNTASLREMASLTHLTLSLHRWDEPSLPGSLRAALAPVSGSGEAVALPRDSGPMAGYVVLADIAHKPVLVLRAEGPDRVYKLGQASVRYFLGIFVLSGMMVALVALMLLENNILVRLGRLSSTVKSISTSSDLSVRVSDRGEDELSQLAGAMNGMLSALEQSQHELRASEERYRAFVEQSSEAVWRVEFQQPLSISAGEEEQVEHILRYGTLVEANDVTARMHGHQRAEDVIGMTFAELFRTPKVPEYVRAFIRGGYRVTDVITEHPLADGGTQYLLDHVVGIVEHDHLIRAWGIQRDITMQRRREAQLRMQTSAINAASDEVIITGFDGRIEFVNPAFERETGFSAGEMMGKDSHCLESGAHDQAFYDELWSTVRSGKSWQGEMISRRKDGSSFTADTIVTPVKNDKGMIEHFVSIKRDITEKKAYEEQLDRLAHHDSLTGLPNRLTLSNRLGLRLAHAREHGEMLAVMFLDLDRFKFVNDTLGHSAGDHLLKLAAERLVGLLRGVDTIARTGGDEFMVILSGLSSTRDAAKIAQRVLDGFSDPFLVEGHEIFVSTSIGVSFYPADGADTETLVKHADAAMYRAKEHGRNSCQFFTRSLSEAANERMTVERRLRQALSRGELEAHYQPRMDVSLRSTLGAEALLRWRQPDGEMIYPSQFIPIAEETGLIVPITEWVLHTACSQNKSWQAAGLAPITVEVNVSAHQLHHNDLISAIRRVLDETGLDARSLGLEITESALMRNPESAIRALQKLRDMGVRLFIDDFGTGHSSLSHLKRLPVDAVKIDRSFVSGVTVNPDDAAIVSAIVAMAHSLKLTTIAEGVENMDQLDFLRAIGCDEIQGFLISPAVPASEFTQRLRTGVRAFSAT